MYKAPQAPVAAARAFHAIVDPQIAALGAYATPYTEAASSRIAVKALNTVGAAYGCSRTAVLRAFKVWARQRGA